jgi:protein-disulfide isomerase
MTNRSREGLASRAGVMVAGLVALLGSAVLHAPAAAQQNEQLRLLQRAAQGRAVGPQHATVTVYEITDFQCPYCARFSREIFPRIDSAFVQTGRVQWVLVNLPLPAHHNAWTAAEAALCAGAAGDRFWPMRDRLFAAQQEWTGLPDPGAAYARYAREIGVAMDAWTSCVAGDRVAPLILQDVIFAASSRVSGTPTFIVNNAFTIVGLKSFEEWRDILEKELRK